MPATSLAVNLQTRRPGQNRRPREAPGTAVILCESDGLPAARAGSVGCVRLTGRRALVVAGATTLIVAAAGTALAVGVPSAPPSQVATLPAGGRSTATLEVVTGTPLLHIRVANLGGTGGTLLRAGTPAGAPPPELRVAQGVGRVRSEEYGLVLLSASSGTSAVTVTLNAAVSWRLDFAGGTQQTVADLRGGRVAGIVFAAGSDAIALTLPRPGGMVPVRLAGGASRFLLSLPGGVPVRVSAAGGAGEVSLDGATYTGVGGGSVFVTPGWAAGAAGVDVDAAAGAATLSVTRWDG